MNNYHKIANIVIRISALTFIISAILELGIMSAGILLMSLELIPQDSFIYEIYFLVGIFYLFGGVILFARSSSLANYIVEGILDEKEQIRKQ